MRIIDVNDVNVATFAYDALGRRIEKKDLADPNNNRRYYYNDKWQVLCEYDDSNNCTGFFIYGNYIDEVLFTGIGLRYYVHDHLYSPVALVDFYGNVIERYEYDAYGKCYIMDASYNPRSSSSYGNPYYFTGRRVDFLNGGNLTLQYNRNRYYDYYTGRWLTHDPLGITPNAQWPNQFDIIKQYWNGLNIYMYVINNPVLMADPFGLECKYDSFAIVAWLALPKGVTPDRIADDLRTIDYTSWLTILHDLLSPWKTGIISFVWDISSSGVSDKLYRDWVSLHVSQCGGDLYALVCEWDCVSSGRWPFRRKVSEFQYCIWLKCEREDACEFLPSMRACQERISRFYFKDLGRKSHVFKRSDIKKIKKDIKKGALIEEDYVY